MHTLYSEWRKQSLSIAALFKQPKSAPVAISIKPSLVLLAA